MVELIEFSAQLQNIKERRVKNEGLKLTVYKMESPSPTKKQKKGRGKSLSDRED
jgi:hypothetical protein